MNNSDDASSEPHPAQQKSTTSFKSLKPLAIIVAVLLIALIAGTSGYLLGLRTNQNTSQSTQRVFLQPSPTTTLQFSIPTPSLSPTQPMVTMNGKTYIDTDYGFKANYPQEFTSRQMGGNILFESEILRISMQRWLSQNFNPYRETIDMFWFTENFNELFDGYYRAVGPYTNLILEEITVGGKNAVKITGKRREFMDTVDIYIFIPRDRDILEISFDVGDGLSRKPEIINDFISTFITTFRLLN
jgi:hypothetical protein